MQRKSLPILMIMACLLGHTSLRAQGDLLQETLSKSPHLSAHEFFSIFPYDHYLLLRQLSDFKGLEADRSFFDAHWDHGGDHFLYYLGEYVLLQQPVTIENMAQTVALGEAFMSSKPELAFHRNGAYRNLGYHFLGATARFLQEGIARGELNAETSPVRDMIFRLQERHVHVTVARGTGEKLIENFKRGNFEYIWRRAQLKVDTHFLPYRIVSGVRTSWALYLIFLVMLFAIYRIWGRKRLVFLASTLIVAGAPLLLLSGIVRDTWQPGYAMRPYRFLMDNLIKIDKIYNQQGAAMGHAIWLSQNHLRPAYLAHGNVSTQFSHMRDSEKVYLATAGGFTNRLKQPEGLTIDRGKIINAVLLPNRHGLVMITRDGRVSAFNLLSDMFRLPDGETLGNPLRNLKDYARLLTWCEQQQATIFQTQLVAHDNQLLIDPEKAVKRFRERRLLALGHDKQGNPYHVLINITEPHMLAPISAEVFVLLRNRGMQLDALLNLDVGLYDILDIYDDQGHPLSDVRGNTNCKEATNLIVYAATSISGSMSYPGN